MEELARELQESVRRAEEETQRSRFLNQIGTTVDLDDVLNTTLEAAVALPRVDAALVGLDPDGDGDERPLGRDRPRPRRGRGGRRRLRAARAAGARGRSSSRTGIRRQRPERSRPRSVCRSSTAPADRLARRLLPRSAGAVRRRRPAPARRARGARRAGARERAPLPGGAPARRPRRADGSPQPPLLPRDARARGRPRAPLSRASRARDRRHRRLQGDQRPDRPSRRRRGARRDRRTHARGRARVRHSVPRRRRRVRLILPESRSARRRRLAARIEQAVVRAADRARRTRPRLGRFRGAPAERQPHEPLRARGRVALRREARRHGRPRCRGLSPQQDRSTGAQAAASRRR